MCARGPIDVGVLGNLSLAGIICYRSIKVDSENESFF